ncbi:MAG: Clp protease N-terminal domain-containing protein, partial [Nakamurella sp.]
MFERFSATARQAVVAAREEAKTMNHPHIGGEHLLIGLAGQGTDPAAVALRKLGIPAAELRTAV